MSIIVAVPQREAALVQHADMRQCRKSVCVPPSPSLRSGLGRRHNGRRPTLDIPALAGMARVHYRLRSTITPCRLRVRSTPLIVENPSDPRAWRTSFAIGAPSLKCATGEPQSAERSFTSEETSHVPHVPSKARIGSQRSAHAAMRRPEHKSLLQTRAGNERRWARLSCLHLPSDERR